MLAAAHGKELHPYEQFQRITLERETDHIPWGRPLFGGEISALFVAPYASMRDAVELAQRLELTLDTAPVLNAQPLAADIPGVSESEVFQRLLRITRTETGFEEENVLPVRFVPMTGRAQRD